MPSTEELNRRHAAKMAARAAGKTEVKTYPSGPKSPGTIYDRSTADGRYQAKLAARAEAKPEPEKGSKPKAKATDEKPEPKPEPEKGKPGR